MKRSNHIKLMVDYNLKDPRILTALDKLGAVDATTIIDCDYKQDTHDKVLINQGTVESDVCYLPKTRKALTKNSIRLAHMAA